MAMRHFKLLGNDALEALADLFLMMEGLGALPTATEHVIVALIPKPKGGNRYIGIYPALYRIWNATRRQEADKWEKEHARPFFAAAKEQAPEDVVWRAQLKNRAARKQGNVVVPSSTSSSPTRA